MLELEANDDPFSILTVIVCVSACVDTDSGNKERERVGKKEREKGEKEREKGKKEREKERERKERKRERKERKRERKSERERERKKEKGKKERVVCLFLGRRAFHSERRVAKERKGHMATVGKKEGERGKRERERKKERKKMRLPQATYDLDIRDP